MLRFTATVILCCLVFPAWAKAQDDAAKKELEKLQGEWKLVAGEGFGNPIPKEELTATLTVKGESYEFASPGETEKGTITLNPGPFPAHVDLLIKEGMSKGTKQLGLYQIKGNRVTFCVAPAGSTIRPKEFKTSAEDKGMLFEFEKVKK